MVLAVCMKQVPELLKECPLDVIRCQALAWRTECRVISMSHNDDYPTNYLHCESSFAGGVTNFTKYKVQYGIKKIKMVICDYRYMLLFLYIYQYDYH